MTLKETWKAPLRTFPLLKRHDAPCGMAGVSIRKVLRTRKHEVPYEVTGGPISEVNSPGDAGGSIREVLYARKYEVSYEVMGRPIS
jgi:hypothetical protein